MVICVNRSYHERVSIYDAVRFQWPVNLDRAYNREVGAYRLVLARVRDKVVGAYRPDEWLASTPENFPQFSNHDSCKKGFRGQKAEPEVQSQYVGKRVPTYYLTRNPVRYSVEPKRD